MPLNNALSDSCHKFYRWIHDPGRKGIPFYELLAVVTGENLVSINVAFNMLMIILSWLLTSQMSSPQLVQVLEQLQVISILPWYWWAREHQHKKNEQWENA